MIFFFDIFFRIGLPFAHSISRWQGRFLRMDKTIKRHLLSQTPADVVETLLPDGRRTFSAEICWDGSDKVLVSHWNRSILEKQITEWMPVMKMARELLAQ